MIVLAKGSKEEDHLANLSHGRMMPPAPMGTIHEAGECQEKKGLAWPESPMRSQRLRIITRRATIIAINARTCVHWRTSSLTAIASRLGPELGDQVLDFMMSSLPTLREQANEPRSNQMLAFMPVFDTLRSSTNLKACQWMLFGSSASARCARIEPGVTD